MRLVHKRPGAWYDKALFHTSQGVLLEYIHMRQAPSEKNPRTLMFLNGIALRHSEWKEQMHKFPNCNLLFFNARGHGEVRLGFSTPNSYLSDCGMDAAELAAHLNLRRTTLVMHSMGCLIGTWMFRRAMRGGFLLESTAYADSMVMVSPAVGNPLETIPKRDFSVPLLEALEKALRNGTAEKFLRWYAKHFKEVQFMAPLYAFFKAATGSGVSFSEFRKYLESVLDVKSETLITAFEAMVRTGDAMGEGMRGLNLPVLVLTGEKDFLVQQVSLEILKVRLIDYEMHIIGNATHFPQAEKPEEFNAYVSDFVRKIDG
ncbi:MAG: alpha/beta hydrolase [Candidatus Micrarchaeota archaeon]|nr:alpha/beta hydrolase [Candidatus Micrarchaeota archaeon]